MKYSLDPGACYWGNTCTKCGSLQGDFHNHENFGGAFLPEAFQPTPAFIKLTPIDLKFDYWIDARHHAVAYEPIFFPEKIQTSDIQCELIKIIIF